MEPNDREVSKLERMADESGEIEREAFTAYAKKSEAFKEYMEAERKSGIDKAEIAFKVSRKVESYPNHQKQAIDRDNSGYITMAELGKLGTKMNQVSEPIRNLWQKKCFPSIKNTENQYTIDALA